MPKTGRKPKPAGEQSQLFSARLLPEQIEWLRREARRLTLVERRRVTPVSLLREIVAATREKRITAPRTVAENADFPTRVDWG